MAKFVSYLNNIRQDFSGWVLQATSDSKNQFPPEDDSGYGSSTFFMDRLTFDRGPNLNEEPLCFPFHGNCRRSF